MGARAVRPPSTRSVPSTATAGNAPGIAAAPMRAPADEPATSWIESPRSANNATAPASYAPLAPPPERIIAVGASRPSGDGAHTARAAPGDQTTASNSGTPTHAFTAGGPFIRRRRRAVASGRDEADSGRSPASARARPTG